MKRSLKEEIEMVINKIEPNFLNKLKKTNEEKKEQINELKSDLTTNYVEMLEEIVKLENCLERLIDSIKVGSKEFEINDIEIEIGTQKFTIISIIIDTNRLIVKYKKTNSLVNIVNKLILYYHKSDELLGLKDDLAQIITHAYKEESKIAEYISLGELDLKLTIDEYVMLIPYLKTIYNNVIYIYITKIIEEAKHAYIEELSKILTESEVTVEVKGETISYDTLKPLLERKSEQQEIEEQQRINEELDAEIDLLQNILKRRNRFITEDIDIKRNK